MLASNFLEILPVDCLLKIAGFLPIHVRFKGMSTCKLWKEILSDTQFWTYIGIPPKLFASLCFIKMHLHFEILH
jgi:hypothetical protein